MDGLALFNAVLAASNEAIAAAPGAKPKTYTIKLACGVTYDMSTNTTELYVDEGYYLMDFVMSGSVKLRCAPAWAHH